MFDELRSPALGMEIKRMRKQENISQEDLAEEIGVSVQYLRNIENKGTIPSTKRLVFLAKKFELSIDYFLSINTVEFDSKQKALCNRIKKCNEDEIDAINGILNAFEGIKKSI